jgi:IS30 family transposase
MNYAQMPKIERYQIKAYLKAGYTQQGIASEPDRAPSIISRELKRTQDNVDIGLNKLRD